MVQILDRVRKSRTATKVASVFVNNGLRQILALCISVFVARSYGATGRGEYALFSSLTTGIALVCSLGLVNALVYKMKMGHLALKQATLLLFTHSAVAIFLILVVVTGAKLLLNPALLEIEQPIWLIGLLFFLYYQGSFLNLLLTSHLLACGDTRNHRRQMVAIPLVTFSTLFAGYALLGEEVFHPVLALVAGECLTAVVLVALLINWGGEPAALSLIAIKDTYSYALRSYLTGLTGTVLTKLDNLVLGAYAGVEAVGFYATAKSFSQVIQSVPMAFSGYLFGLFVERGFTDGLRLVFKSSGAILFLTLCVALPLFLAPSWILDFVYGSEFTEAATSLTILAAAAVVVGSSNPILGFLNANNRPGASSMISVISAALTVFLFLVFVPSMSYNGAAYATLAGSVAILILRYAFILALPK